jgi:hypothetical protein
MLVKYKCFHFCCRNKLTNWIVTNISTANQRNLFWIVWSNDKISVKIFLSISHKFKLVDTCFLDSSKWEIGLMLIERKLRAAQFVLENQRFRKFKKHKELYVSDWYLIICCYIWYIYAWIYCPFTELITTIIDTLFVKQFMFVYFCHVERTFLIFFS